MIIPITINTTVSFQQKHQLKTYWRKGLLPTVKRGLYLDKLTQENLSIEHIQPKSKGGSNGFDNVALSSKDRNNLRGDKDIREFLTKEMVDIYCKQFEGVKIGKRFRGDTYIRMIKNTLKRLGVYN